jgi:hypothetical protein
MSTIDFYTERAADCRTQAEAATLANVRNRCLSSAAAWDTMAGRVRQTQSFRAENEASK